VKAHVPLMSFKKRFVLQIFTAVLLVRLGLNLGGSVPTASDIVAVAV
jgi:hypothetical protein